MAVDLSDLPPFLTYQQVAEVVGVTRDTLRGLLARGELLVVRMTERTHRISRVSLAGLMEGQFGVAPALADDVGHAVDIDGAAAQLGISRHIVTRLIEAGDLNTFRVGARARVTRDELARFIHTRTAAPESAPQTDTD